MLLAALAVMRVSRANGLRHGVSAMLFLLALVLAEPSVGLCTADLSVSHADLLRLSLSSSALFRFFK